MQLSLARLSWKAQIGVFLAVSMLGAGGFYKYWVEPLQAELATHEKKLAVLKKGIDKGLATARQLPEFQRQVAELEARLASLRQVLPEEKDAGDLLRRIQTLATAANLQITSFKPAPIVTREMHAEWPINLELDGTYHNLGRFFDEVAKFSRIINVGAIQIKAKERGTGGSTITAACVATTFVLLEAPPRPAAGKGAARRAPAQKGA